MTTTQKAVDTATTITDSVAAQFSKAAYLGIGRYVAGRYTLTPLEVNTFAKHRLKIFSYYETLASQISDFTVLKAQRDSKQALTVTRIIGQHYGSAICPSVDFEATANDLNQLEAYFVAYKKAIQPHFLLGGYGSDFVINSLDHVFDVKVQTSAWSAGRISKFADMYQHNEGMLMYGISVDELTVYNEIGWWAPWMTSKIQVQVPAKPSPKLPKDVMANTTLATAVEKAMSIGALGVYADDTFRPEQPLTRAQAAVMTEAILRAVGK